MYRRRWSNQAPRGAAPRVVVCLSLALFLAATAPAAADGAGARITEVYPDTYAPGDAGEYVAVRFDSTDTTGWSIEDGDDATRLPNRTLDGVVYFGDEGAPPNRSDNALGLSLNNRGEMVRIRNSSGAVVDGLGYGDRGSVSPSEGEVVVSEMEDGSRRGRDT